MNSGSFSFAIYSPLGWLSVGRRAEEQQHNSQHNSTSTSTSTSTSRETRALVAAAMFVTEAKKRSLAMITAEEGAWRPPAPSTQSTPAEIKWKLSADRQQKLRRVPNRSLPTEHVKVRMPTEQYGACCKGTKKWGDGKGSRAFGDGITYVCHMCNYELLKPMWALTGCSSEQEFNEQMEQVEHGVLPHHDTRVDRMHSTHQMHRTSHLYALPSPLPSSQVAPCCAGEWHAI